MPPPRPLGVLPLKDRMPMGAVTFARALGPRSSMSSIATATEEINGEEQGQEMEDEEHQEELNSSQESGRKKRNTGTHHKPQPLTLKFYRPATQALLERAKLFMRGEIAIVDPFPDARNNGEQLARDVLAYAFREAKAISGPQLVDEGVSA